MKKNGFTLIELLGVIVILSLLMILVFPSIINSVKSSSDKTDELTFDLIYNATNLFIENHMNDFPKKNGNKYVITLNDLIDDGLLASPIKLNNDTDITNNKCVQVVYNDGYEYELKDNDDCEERKIICSAVTEKTLGNIPSGDFEYGDEYICDPGDGIERIFYVLENGATTTLSKSNGSHHYEETGVGTSGKDEVTLIMSGNYYSGWYYWCNSTGLNYTNNICNGDGLESELEVIRQKWSEVEVNLPTYDQLYAVNKEKSLSNSLWLVDGLDSDNGYWTATAYKNDSEEAWIVNNTSSALISYSFVHDENSFGDWTQYGIRPVITISNRSLN